MLLLVGLGNPGPESAGHRHNVGAMVIDAIVERHRFGRFRNRFHGQAAEGTLGGEKVVALKPETFMNASGEAVADAVRFYKLSPDDVLVVHDDIDLAPGKLRIKQGGGDGGHNGLRSIDGHLGPDYHRLRIGVGHPGHKDEVADYVLKNFSKAEKAWLDPLIEAIAKEADLLASDGNKFLTRVALLLTPREKRRRPTRAKVGFNCGIVGLPNVGKSTLFNALSATAAAEVANYPFCTIEPNVGRVAVPDPRLDALAKLAKSARVVPTYLEFVDIAGLVRGASQGEGLGNQFLANIREVDAILHVLRCFESEDVTHVDESVDPARDAETVDTELMLADLASLEKRTEAMAKKVRGGEKALKAELAVMERAKATLAEGKPALMTPVGEDERPLFERLQLLTAKPVLFIANVEEAAAATGNAHAKAAEEYAKKRGAGLVVISAAIEAEVAALESPEERADFLAAMGLKETGLSRVIQAGYALLNLITFFTAGPKEARAWTVPKGTKAAQAAGTIHTDFERGFIAAATIAYADFIAHQGEQGAKDAGKMRLEGRDYVVKDGDVMHFRFNV